MASSDGFNGFMVQVDGFRGCGAAQNKMKAPQMLESVSRVSSFRAKPRNLCRSGFSYLRADMFA